MKKVQKQLKRALSMALALSMAVGMLSGCGLGQNTASDVVVVQDEITEVSEITLEGVNQDAFLLNAGETPQITLDGSNGTVEDIAVTPDDATYQPYQYYTVMFTLTAKENESFAKTVSITLDGVELQVKKWTKDKLVIEYTALALPETVITDEMAKVTDYGDAATEKSLGTAKVQALLDSELTLFSEDGGKSYVIQKGFVPLFMVPSFVANAGLEQITDGETVQILKEHGEKDFAGAIGEWYKIAYKGKTGYLPITFVKDAKIQKSAGDEGKTPETTIDTNKTAQTRPAVKPAAGQNRQTSAQTTDNDTGSNSGSNSDNNSGSNSGNNSGSSADNKPDNGPGNDNIEKTVYYQIDFALGGGINSQDAMLPSALMVAENSVIDVSSLATPSVPGYLFDAWFYDSALTRQVQSGDRITGNLTLYAKLREITGEEVEEGQDNYVSSVDVDAKSFRIALLKPAGNPSTEVIGDIANIYDIADQEKTLALDISEPETVTIGDGSYDKYYISSSELEAGATYQMQLLSNSYFIYYNDQIQPAAVRLYNFTTEMPPVENLSLNSNLVYLKKEEVRYTEGSDYLSGLFNVNVADDMTKLNTVDGSGSFTYTGDQKIGVGTTVVIYDGAKAPALGEDGLKSAQQYDGNAAYITISKIEGNSYYYGVAEAEDVLFTPDILPLNVADDEDTSNTTVTIDTVKLDFSGGTYQGMGLDANTTVDVGDYLAFYSGSLETTDTLTYGVITAIAVSGENTILTYTDISESEVLDSMTVHSTEEMDFELDEDTARSIEAEIEQDAIDSGFALEAANYLATVALATDQLQSLTGELGLQNLTLAREDGSAVTQSDLQLMAGNSVSVEGLQVRANISRSLSHLSSGYSKNGANAQLEVSFNVKIGSGRNQLTLKVAATFEQEILLNLNIKGKAVWGKKWIFPYIKDYRITTNLDAGSYTGVGITATILAEGNEPEYDWSDVNHNLSDQIHQLMDTQDKFFNQDITSAGGGLAEKYANMLENNPDWIDLVNVNIFSNEARILAGIIVVGVQGDFVISAKVNIMLGMSFQYSVAKRYTFTLNVFSKTSSSNCVDLTKSNYQFDMYVMGTLGLRAGIRLTVYAGLFSKKVAAIGITAEAGAYVQMWGYFYYSTSWKSGSGKTSSASGAMLLEVGAYLEIRFLATAFGGTFKYAPVLYDKYWPLWNMGSAENVYGFNYETTVGEVDDKDIHMGANTSVALPIDRMNMSYMNLRSGDTADRNYTYSDFDITTTGNFKYENGIISVIPQDGSNEEKGTIILTWKGAPLSFTSKPLSCEMDITWSDPSRINSVSYDLHGGTAYENGEPLTGGIPSTKVITGATTAAPEVELKKEAYTFGGWYADVDDTKAWDFAVDKVREDLVLHAKWIPVAYEITYELDGGTNAEANPAAYTIEEAVTLSDPARAGYRFLGWYTAADDTGSKVTGIPAGSSGARTLYAKWEAEEQAYEIHHMQEKLDGSGYEDAETTTAAALTGESVTIGKEQSKTYTGFTFDENKTEDSTGIIPGEGPLVLKLYYSRNSYGVTFVNETGAAPEAQSVPYQGNVTEPEELSREGYTFTGWYVAAENPRQWNFAEDVVTGATRLIAGWTANTYNVTFDRQGGIGGDENVLAVYDSAMPGIHVPARAGYQFLGYYDAAEGGTQYYNADGSSAADWDKAGENQDSDVFTLYAQWKANSYQVTFDANGGEGSMENLGFIYDADGSLSRNTFVREGYTFAGWAKDGNADTAEYADEASVRSLTTEAEGTVILYAVWQPVHYQITFNGNGGEGTMEDQQMCYDTAALLSRNTFTKTGYHFAGWATTSDAESVEYEDQADVKNLSETEGRTVTLYAVWEANVYMVAFYPNGGKGTMENQQFTYDQEGVALSKNSYSRPGYEFVGWAATNDTDTAEYKDEESVRNLVTEQNGVLTLYAVWQAARYRVNFDSNKGNGSSEPDIADPVSVIYGTAYGELPTVSREGYDFIGWYTEAGIAIRKDNTVDITADITLYAHWNAKKYSIGFDSNKGDGSSEPTTAERIVVTYDETYNNLPEVSRDGYTFNGWYTEKAGGNEIKASDRVTLTAEQTLYAQWTVNSYKVTFNAGEGSFADGSTNKFISQNYDSNYQMPETPVRRGYTFEGWYTGENSGTQVQSTDVVTLAADHELYARWTVNSYTVTFDANGGSTDKKNTSVTYGAAYGELPSASRTGYRFDGWYTDKTAGTEITEKMLVDVNEDTILYAHWSAMQYQVSFDSNKGSGSSTPTKAQAIKVTYDGFYENLPEVSRDGYTFNGWYTAKDGGSRVDSSDRVTVAEEQTLYAHWTANSYKVTFHTGEGSFADGTVSKVISQTYDSTYQFPDEPTRSNYIFQGWYTKDNAGVQIKSGTAMDNAQDHELYARWSQTEVVTVMVGGVTLEYTGIPVYAKTDKTTGAVTIGGSSSDYNIMLDKNVLTLNGANIIYTGTASYSGAIYSKNELTINLMPGTTNSVTNNASNSNCCGGIYISGNTLTISGSGTLNVTAGENDRDFSDAIYASYIIIDGAKIHAQGRKAAWRSRGICAAIQLTMKNGADITAVGGEGQQSYGIWCNYIVIDSCSGTASSIAEPSESSDSTRVAMFVSETPQISGVKLNGKFSDSSMSWTAE